MALHDLIDEIRNYQQGAEDQKKKEKEALRVLMERIRYGESTGDVVRDFTIIYHGTLSEEATQPYRALQAQLSGKHLVLVVNEEEKIRGCPGIVAPDYIDPMFIGIERILRMGESRGITFNVTNGHIIIQTPYHLQRGYLGDWQKVDGPITLYSFELLGLGKTVDRRDTPMCNDLTEHFGSGLRVYTENIEEHIRQFCTKASYEKALTLLRRT
ncbi:hypothetical protein HY639_02035 [Candidatus Woesearchaeota archaeon]|nr:hypothetical protein [Candidatus Woesearchaeota archaeon]